MGFRAHLLSKLFNRCDGIWGSPSTKCWWYLSKLLCGLQDDGWKQLEQYLAHSRHAQSAIMGYYFHSHCRRWASVSAAADWKPTSHIAKAHLAQWLLLKCEIVYKAEDYLTADPENGAGAQAGRARCAGHLLLSRRALWARRSRCLVFWDDGAGWGPVCPFTVWGCEVQQRERLGSGTVLMELSHVYSLKQSFKKVITLTASPSGEGGMEWARKDQRRELGQLDTGSNTYHVYVLLLGAEDSDGCDNAECKDDKIYGLTGVCQCVLFFLSPGLFQKMVKVLDFYQGNCVPTHIILHTISRASWIS